MIEWKAPPTSRRGNIGDHRGIADELRAHPGEWGLILRYARPEQASHRANTIRHGKSRFWQPAGSFEATSRRVGNEFGVFARFVEGAA